jgi:hypothetical protein
MDLARAPRRRPLTARKKGSGYENGGRGSNLSPTPKCALHLARAHNVVAEIATKNYSPCLEGPVLVLRDGGMRLKSSGIRDFKRNIGGKRDFIPSREVELVKIPWRYAGSNPRLAG